MVRERSNDSTLKFNCVQYEGDYETVSIQHISINGGDWVYHFIDSDLAKQVMLEFESDNKNL